VIQVKVAILHVPARDIKIESRANGRIVDTDRENDGAPPMLGVGDLLVHVHHLLEGKKIRTRLMQSGAVITGQGDDLLLVRYLGAEQLYPWKIRPQTDVGALVQRQQFDIFRRIDLDLEPIPVPGLL